MFKTLKNRFSRSQDAVPRVAKLGRGVVWYCCELSSSWSPSPEVTEKFASFITTDAQQHVQGVGVTIPEVSAALQKPVTSIAECRIGSRVQVLVPEAFAEWDYCDWKGDGHFDLSAYPAVGLPTLGQVIAFVQLIDAAVDRSELIVHLSTEKWRATGAVLAGAVLVLAQGLSARAAWAEILHAAPAPSRHPAEAWDRFPRPFARSSETCGSSVTVLDCLTGLQYARDLCWFGPQGYRAFKCASWQLLRKKFDYSWVIPGEIVCMANPWGTAQNPAFPGLLSDDADSEDESFDNAALCCENFTCCGGEPDEELKEDTITVLGRGAQLDPMLKERTFTNYLVTQQVTKIARLNFSHECPNQDAYIDSFAQKGIQSYEWAFEDGSIPPPSIVEDFMSTCSAAKQEGTCVGVHCMSGLGRTGVLVGAYAVAHHRIPGTAWHGWVRMCRPGSVLTEQQEIFLRSLSSFPFSPKLSGLTSYFRKRMEPKQWLSFQD